MPLATKPAMKTTYVAAIAVAAQKQKARTVSGISRRRSVALTPSRDCGCACPIPPCCLPAPSQMTGQPPLGGWDEQDEGDDRAAGGVGDRVLDHLGAVP